jgi:hypothetical protein
MKRFMFMYVSSLGKHIKKLRGFIPQAKYTERPPLIGEVSANFNG